MITPETPETAAQALRDYANANPDQLISRRIQLVLDEQQHMEQDHLDTIRLLHEAEQA